MDMLMISFDRIITGTSCTRQKGSERNDAYDNPISFQDRASKYHRANKHGKLQLL